MQAYPKIQGNLTNNDAVVNSVQTSNNGQQAEVKPSKYVEIYF